MVCRDVIGSEGMHHIFRVYVLGRMYNYYGVTMTTQVQHKEKQNFTQSARF